MVQPPRFGIYAYPWALARLDVERQLDRITSLGFDGIQLAFSYHAAPVLSPRDRSSVLHLGDCGSLWFDPGEQTLTRWRVRPEVASEAAKAVPVILQGMAERGLQGIAWVVFLYSHALARAYPRVAVRNAFGDASGSHLCLCQPDVCDYVHRLVEAVLATQVERGSGGITLTGLHAESLTFHGFMHGMQGLKVGAEPSDRVTALLSLCFCDCCRQQLADMGVNAEEAADSVRREVLDTLNGGSANSSAASSLLQA